MKERLMEVLNSYKAQGLSSKESYNLLPGL